MGAKELILLSSTLHENTKYICLFCHARTRDQNIKTPVVVKTQFLKFQIVLKLSIENANYFKTSYSPCQENRAVAFHN